jgi:phospholipid transport system substrate-binding protein
MLYFAGYGQSRYGAAMFSFSSSALIRPFRPTTAIVVLAVMSAGTFTAQAARDCDGTTRDDALALVRNTTSKLFAAVEVEGGVLSENPARARQLVDEFITPHVDLTGFSKLVLGKYWRRSTADQQQRFLTQFRTLILRTYATALTSYTGIEVEYLPMREESRENFATVRSIIPSTGGDGVKVNYRLHCRKNVWKLFDVSIAGISMVTTYRTAFSAEVKRSGIDGLIEILERKNDGVDA